MDFACDHRVRRAAARSGAAIQSIVDALVRRDPLSMWRFCLLFALCLVIGALETLFPPNGTKPGSSVFGTG